jgi:hypothetical protein
MRFAHSKSPGVAASSESFAHKAGLAAGPAVSARTTTFGSNSRCAARWAFLMERGLASVVRSPRAASRALQDMRRQYGLGGWPKPYLFCGIISLIGILRSEFFGRPSPNECDTELEFRYSFSYTQAIMKPVFLGASFAPKKNQLIRVFLTGRSESTTGSKVLSLSRSNKFLVS